MNAPRWRLELNADNRRAEFLIRDGRIVLRMENFGLEPEEAKALRHRIVALLNADEQKEEVMPVKAK